MLGDSLRRRRGDPKHQEPERPEPERWTKAKRRLPSWTVSWPRWLLLALGVLIVSYGVGYLLATQVFFPRPETAGRSVEVPELYGQPLAEAETAIRGLGLRVGEVRQIKNTTTETGRVLAQDPVPGQRLLPGAEVALGVSAGPPELRVPPVVGLGEGTARELLEAVGFDVATQQTRSAEFPVGVVARVEPEPGTEQALPSEITIVVSTGPPADSMADSLGLDPERDPGDPG